MIFEFKNYIIDIDVEKTRDFYTRAETITEGCDCLGCRNYEKWAMSADTKISQVFRQIGVQMEKASEVYVNCQNEDGSLLYGGFYHICGRILQGGQVWNEISENHRVQNAMSFVDLDDDYRVAFTDDVCLLEKNFPMPVIQMELLANIPWVLPEKCSY